VGRQSFNPAAALAALARLVVRVQAVQAVIRLQASQEVGEQVRRSQVLEVHQQLQRAAAAAFMLRTNAPMRFDWH